MASMLRKLYLADLGWASNYNDFDPALLQALLSRYCASFTRRDPRAGRNRAFDVKHIYAWVKENNERVYVKDRYAKAQQLKGDRDCTLGVKKKTNREQADGSTKVFKSTFGVMAQGWSPPPTRSMAMSSSPNIPNPLMKTISPIFVHSMNKPSSPSKAIPPTSPLILL